MRHVGIRFFELAEWVSFFFLVGCVFAPVVYWFVYWLRRGFKVRCPACDGTGLCELGGDDTVSHTCCNSECVSTYAPAHRVPAGFKGSVWPKTGIPPYVRRGLPDAEQYAVVGRGYVRGSLLARLLHGGPRDPLGYREGDGHVLPTRTLTTDIRCFHHTKENVL